MATLQQAWQWHQAGRLDQAEAAYRELLVSAPSADAYNCLGILLHQTGRTDEALQLYRQAVAFDPRNAALQINLARAALKAGRPELALVASEAALALGDNESAHVLKGAALRDMDRVQESLEAFRQAALRYPRSFAVQFNLAASLLATGDAGEAEQLYLRLVASAPGDARAWLGLGNARAARRDAVGAEEAYARAAGLDPGLPGLWTQRGLLAIQCGRPADAVPLLRAALQRMPTDQSAVAGLAVATALAGSEDLSGVLAFDRVIQTADPDVGQAPVDRARLVEEILAHPSLVDERSGKTTRGGAQTADLSDASTPALRDFVARLRHILPGMLDTLARHYAQAGHPLAGTAPRRWQLNLWATVLRSGGHQAPHLHPAGWMSGVYYVLTPGIEAGSEAGWIEFGCAPEELVGADTALPTRRIQPCEGLMLTFPSYLYHRTVPHADDRLRISLAFDVIPA